MKKTKIILASFIFFVMVSALTQKFCTPSLHDADSPAQNNSTQAVQPVQATESKQPTSSSPEPQPHGYKIQEYNGNIAVFEKGQQKPFRKTEIAVKNLPEADRKDLKNGIDVETNEELQTLLEDYLS